MIKSAAIKLDEKLMNDETISSSLKNDYIRVHDLLNKNVKTYDVYLMNDDFKGAEADLRKWLKTLQKQGAGPEKLNSFLKCGMAHLCFDYMENIGIEPTTY
ncbi:MAG TPA: hypothetical protein VJ861_12375 [Treponemataceae bacterium]|nr:hypothetical protein [Treponemataceae bacterium]